MNLFGMLSGHYQRAAETAQRDQRRYEVQIMRQQQENFDQKRPVATEALKGKIIETEWKRI